jgi:hypothetical protein
MASGLSLIDPIDWSAPWLQAWREVGQPLSLKADQGVPVFQACNDALTALQKKKTAPACPVHFVAQSALPEGQAYEQFIHETQSVPTRDGLHDFFNALCWMHFPLAKKQLNHLQAAAIQAQGVGAVRGPVRDAVTVFDENACLIQLPDVVWEALQTRQWQTAFVTHRALWQEAHIQIFGHAALEKLVKPYKAITVHLWCAQWHSTGGMGCVAGARPASRQTGAKAIFANAGLGHTGLVGRQPRCRLLRGRPSLSPPENGFRRSLIPFYFEELRGLT